MKKKIVCADCRGLGWSTEYATDVLGHKLKAIDIKCDNCNGTGKIEVPMTNFDYIKSLTIDEMAKHFAMHKEPHFPSSPCYVCEYNNPWFCEKDGECNDEHRKKVYKQWLEQEYEEN